MDEDQVRAYVEFALGSSITASRIIPLKGNQGLYVCRIECGRYGSYIFKCVAESGKLELRLTAMLSRLAPYCICPVVRYEEDEKRHLYWILEEDAGKIRLGNRPMLDNFLTVAITLAKLQTDAMNYLQYLQILGLPILQSEEWEIMGLQFIQLLSKINIPFLFEFRDDLESLLWEVDSLARDACSIPCSLIHGDLHAGNIAWGEKDSTIRFLDWGSAYLAPALCGIDELLIPSVQYLRNQDAFERVRNAYFKEFQTVFGKMSHWTKSSAACSALVHMHMTLQSLRNLTLNLTDEYATAHQMRLLISSLKKWAAV